MKAKMWKRKTNGILILLAVLLMMLPFSVISASAAETEIEGALWVEIPAPKIGNTPWFDISNPYSIRDGLRVSSISWYDRSGYGSMSKDSVFERDHQYSCYIELATLPGYRIKDLSYRDDYNNRRWTNAAYVVVNGIRQESDNNGEDIYPPPNAHGDEGSIIFPVLKEAVSYAKFNVKEPVSGWKPSFYAEISETEKYNWYNSSDRPEFKRGVCWYDVTDDKAIDEDTPFVEGHKYSVTVCIKAAQGYVFYNENSSYDNSPYFLLNESKRCEYTQYTGDDKGEIYLASYTFEPCKNSVVKNIEITGVELPHPGVSPNYKAVPGGDYGYLLPTESDYKNGICWYDITANKNLKPDSDDKFVMGHEYRLMMLVRARELYDFSTNSNGDTTFVKATIDSRTPDNIGSYEEDPLNKTVAFTMKTGLCVSEVLSDVEAEGIDPPLPGRKPDYTANIPGYVDGEGDNYRIDTGFDSDIVRNGISWWDYTDNKYLDPNKDVFIEGHIYTININLAALTGRSFKITNGGKPDVKGQLNGMNAAIASYVTADVKKNIILRYSFPTTAKTEIESVSVSCINEPVPGEKPVFYAESDDNDKYEIFYDFNTEKIEYAPSGVSWYDKTAGRYLTPGEDVFEDGHAYTCSVYLLPQTGYAFPSDTDSNGVFSIPGKLNGRTAESVGCGLGRLQTAGGAAVSYTFEPGEPARLYTFSIDDIPRPLPGCRPQYYGTAGRHTTVTNSDVIKGMSGYHYGVMWYDHTDKKHLDPEDEFVEDHYYSCNVILEADKGYLFNVDKSGDSYLYGTFNGVNTRGTANVGYEYEREHYIDVSYYFGRCYKISIVRLELTGIAVPYDGEKASFKAETITPGTYIDTDYNNEKFHNGVAWLDMTEFHYMQPDETFILGREYRPEVVVNAETGYFFYTGGKSYPQVYCYINSEQVSAMSVLGANRPLEESLLVYAEGKKCSLAPKPHKITVNGGKATLGGNSVTEALFNDEISIACDESIRDSFDHWECDGEFTEISDFYAPETTLFMPDEDLTVTAVTKSSAEHKIIVIGGRALDKDGNEISAAEFGRSVTISYNAPQNKKFIRWEVDSSSVEIDDVNSSVTKLLMPNHDVKVTAVEEDLDINPDFSVTIIGGKAYDELGNEITAASSGDKVTLVWDPADTGYTFIRWITSDPSVIDDVNSETTTFIMPMNDILIEAEDKEETVSPPNKFEVTFKDPVSGETNSMMIEEGDNLIFPECSFTAPKGKRFGYWDYDGKHWNPGEELSVYESITVNAGWVIPVSSADCTVKAPVGGEKPDFSPISADDKKYTVKAELWYLNDGDKFPELKADDTFASGKKYCVRIEFIPAPGYEFTDDVVFTINGKIADTVGEMLAEITLSAADTPDPQSDTDKQKPDSDTDKTPDDTDKATDTDSTTPSDPGTDTPKPDEKTKGIFGDVDKDGYITAADALSILRQSVGMESFSEELLFIANVDDDSGITANDALAVLRNSVGFTDDNKVGKPFEI